MTEPCFDLAHLAHVEMYTDKFEESLDFFTRVYGLTVSGQDEKSTYLRAWDDYEFHSLKLTRHQHHRRRPILLIAPHHREALERRVAAIEGKPLQEPRVGRRRSRSRPRFPVRGSVRPCLRDLLGHGSSIGLTRRTRRRSRTWRSRFHATGACPAPHRSPEPACDRCERVPRLHGNLPRLPGDRDHPARQWPAGGCWFTINNKTYDLALYRRAWWRRGEAAPCHLCGPITPRGISFAPQTSSWKTAFTSRPGRTSTPSRGTFFLYVWNRPANRVELANSGARLILQPDWEPVIWTEADRRKGQAWGLKTIESFHTHVLRRPIGITDMPVVTQHIDRADAAIINELGGGRRRHRA